ncbi:MAG TPA: DoxX family protein [Chryseolinea sp.]|nr:DoxX family protein [Chryseolinea sp.]
MKNNTKIAVTRILTALVTLIIILSASSKLAFVPQLVEIFSKIGLLSYLNILGITELMFLALFIWKKTRKLGLLLLTGYFGGAMAVEISHGTFFIAPATILTLIWITAYLHDEKMFISENKEVTKTVIL